MPAPMPTVRTRAAILRERAKLLEAVARCDFELADLGDAPSAHDSLLDVAKLIEEGAIEARAIDGAIRSGLLPCTRLGRKRFVRNSDVLSLVERAPIAPKPPKQRTSKPTEAAKTFGFDDAIGGGK